MKNVLRLKPGENIILCDGYKNDYIVRVDRFQPDAVHTIIIETKENNTESPVSVTLFQGLPKSDKMDFIIQKGIELGVKKIVPVITERTIVRIDNKKDIENKLTRWRRIALEAAKQCNRGVIPDVSHPVSFAEALELSRDSMLSLIPYEKEMDKGLREYINNSLINSVSVMIGPEGGFSEKEVEKAISSGIKPVTLGPRILRAETAGLAVLSILMYELGDIGKTVSSPKSE